MSRLDAATEAGLFKVKIKISTGSLVELQEIYLDGQQEWNDLREAYKTTNAEGWSGKYAAIPPGVPVLLIRLENREVTL